MEIKVEAVGGPASGKTYMLRRIKQLLEDKGFVVEFPGELHTDTPPHEHALIGSRPDNWVMENIARR